MSSQGEMQPMKLPSVLDMQAASEFAEQIKTHLNNAGDLIVDASAVDVLTTPCLQILAAVAKDGRLKVMSPSAEFISAFQDLSLEQPAAFVAEAAPSIAPTADVAAEAAPASPTDTPAMPSGPQRILTIDDSKTMRDMLKLTLLGAGYEVLQGVDGVDGIEVLGDQHIDAVITDINMPRMDGYEVIRELRKMSRLDNTPILVLTTESEKDKRDIARQAGATGWMVKPFDPEKLITTLRKVLPVNGADANTIGAKEHA